MSAPATASRVVTTERAQPGRAGGRRAAGGDAAPSAEPGVRLRPRRAHEIVDLSLRYLSCHPALWRGFGGLIALEVVLLGGLGGSLYQVLHPWVALGWTLAAAALLNAAVEQLASIRIGRHLFGQPSGVGQLAREVLTRPATWLRIGLGQLPALTAAFLVGSISGLDGMISGALTYLVLSPVFGGISPFIRETLLLEQLPWRKARVRSRTLFTRSSTAPTALMRGFSLRLFLSLSFAAMGAGAAFLLVLLKLMLVFAAIAAPLGYLFAGPIVGTVHLFAYVQARTEQEGWDIQVRFHAIEARLRAAQRFHDD